VSLLKGFFKPKKQVKPSSSKSEAPTSFPFEIVQVAGSEAIGTLEDLRLQGKREGFTAVLLGGPENVALLSEAIEDNSITPEEVLEQAGNVEVQIWFSDRVKQEPDYYEAELGEWPSKLIPNNSLMAHLDLLSTRRSRPLKSVCIAKIPIADSWQVPAYLKLGGWNECPLPEHQVAISRYWHELYGADIAAVTKDTIEYLVEAPPVDKESAEKLAREQFIFCTDIVYQGTETIRNLAATLMNAKAWFFWWD
jgi:hypothetical protein